MITAEKLRALCRRHDVGALYAFGSRAAEVAAFVQGQGPLNSTSRSDIDLGVLPRPGHRLDVDDRVRLTIEPRRPLDTLDSRRFATPSIG